jgi:dCTP deaminase
MLVCGEELRQRTKELIGSEPASLGASVTLHLDSQFLEYDVPPDKPIILPTRLPTRSAPLTEEGYLRLAPGESVLACTAETVRLPLDIFGWLQTKGNIARAFLGIVVSDSQVDPGYAGKITLELVNHGPMTLDLRPGIEVAQLYLFRLSQPVSHGYNGRFQGAAAPTAMTGE